MKLTKYIRKQSDLDVVTKQDFLDEVYVNWAWSYDEGRAFYKGKIMTIPEARAFLDALPGEVVENTPEYPRILPEPTICLCPNKVKVTEEFIGEEPDAEYELCMNCNKRFHSHKDGGS